MRIYTGRARRAEGAALVIVLAVGGVGCGARHSVHHDSWTIFDAQAALHENRNIAQGPTLPQGMPATAMIKTNADGVDELAVNPAFSEGQPAAFVTTELWVNFDEVEWVQPLYAQVATWGDAPTLVAAAPLLVDVGPGSAFYSPFWRVEYAVVSRAPPVGGYSSTRDLLDSGVTLYEGPVKTCPLRPVDFHAGALVDPFYGMPLDTIPERDLAIDGKPIGALDFGVGLVDEATPSRLEPLPLFLFVRRPDGGAAAPLAGAARVLGVGPLFSGAKGTVLADPSGLPMPMFGAYWRIYLATVPPGAEAFMAVDQPVAVATASAAGIDPRDFEGRVALDATCFAAPTFPTSCVWLDSQARVEGTLGALAISPSEITGTCPFVFFNKLPVKRG